MTTKVMNLFDVANTKRNNILFAFIVFSQKEGHILIQKPKQPKRNFIT